MAVFLQLRRTLFFAFFLVVISFFNVSSYPDHGSQNWLGYNYWNNRYNAEGLNHPSDWNGFWNSYNDGRNKYERKSSDLSGAACTGCSCNNAKKILECKGYAGTTLHLLNRDIPVINEIPVTLTTIKIVKSSLQSLGDEIFHNLTELKTLQIIYNPLFDDFPDVSKNSKLTELDLFNNKIRLWRHNFTALPKSLERINLVENDLDFIPDDWFDLPNLKYIALGHNKLKVFPALGFLNTKQLLYLGVDYNQITTISYPNIQRFVDSQLVHLNLSNNAIESVASEAFQNLAHLKILELHKNNLAEITAKVFYKMPELLHLDLRGNKLQTITAVGNAPLFEDLPKLKCLILMDQETGAEHVMYNVFEKLPLLEDLWLNGNKLTNFPHPALWQSLPSLKYLHLEENNINSLTSFASTDYPVVLQQVHSGLQASHKPFKELSSLLRLFVHTNQISKINENDLWYLTNLQQFYGDNNQLSNATVHPEAFRNLTSLTRLDLAGNRFYYVPTAITTKSRLPKINHLELRLNKITYLLKGVFSQFDTLRYLDLEGNQIVAIEDGAFPSDIGQIDLSSNKFKFKHENPFTNLTQLTKLRLRSNLIDVIPETALHGLTSLSRLDLANNKIGRLMKGAFKDLVKLKYLLLSNNELSYIEDGTLSVSSYYDEILLHNNHLTSLPAGGDFSNKRIDRLRLDNNRLTSIPANTFVNTTCSGSSKCTSDGSRNAYERSWNFRGNHISKIETGAFNNVSGPLCSLLFSTGTPVNPLTTLESRAFVQVKACYIELYKLQLKKISSETFVDTTVSRDIELYNNMIETVEQSAFKNVQGMALKLADNRIPGVTVPMFGVSGSSFSVSLDLSNNRIETLSADAFKGLKSCPHVYLRNNKLVSSPFSQLKDIDPLYHLYLQNNQIPTINPGELDAFTKLRRLFMENNNITKLGKDLFKNQGSLYHLDLSSNLISEIEVGAFNDMRNLETLYLHNNKIEFLPAFPSLPDVQTLFLSNNKITNIGQNAFGLLPKLSNLDMSSNQLQCDGNVYKSFVDVIKSLNAARAAVCVGPSRVAGAQFYPKGSYESFYRQEFTYSPVNINASAPKDFQINVTWDRPNQLYPVRNTSGNATLNSWNETKVVNVTYTVTCYSADAPSVTATTTATTYLFDKKTNNDNVKAGTDYTCYVRMTVVAYNGTVQVGKPLGVLTTRTTPKSEEVSLTTVEGKAPTTNSTMNPLYFYLNATYYDFEFADSDFFGASYANTFKDPTYIASPYGSWLSIPSSPSFSTWFRSNSARNREFKDIIELKKTGESDSNGAAIYRYYEAKFFPVDGKGFGAQGQRDCYTNALRNYGFTTTVKGTFTFTGNEQFAFSGGEELWVFINRKRVVQLFHSPTVSATPCRLFSLKPAATKGGGTIVPKQGTINKATGKCEGTSDITAEQFNMELLVGLPYRIDLFLAERSKCDSLFMYQMSGTTFVRPGESTLPVDHVVQLSENTRVGAVVQVFMVADAFTSGPYTVSIVDGNEERRFEVKKGSYSAPAPPPTPAPPSFNLKGETIILCPNATNYTVTPIPTVAPGIYRI